MEVNFEPSYPEWKEAEPNKYPRTRQDCRLAKGPIQGRSYFLHLIHVNLYNLHIIRFGSTLSKMKLKVKKGTKALVSSH